MGKGSEVERKHQGEASFARHARLVEWDALLGEKEGVGEEGCEAESADCLDQEMAQVHPATLKQTRTTASSPMEQKKTHLRAAEAHSPV